jgi:predicted dehydrogenase
MKDVKCVFGQVKTIVHDIEGEDLGVAVINFKNGALGTIEGGTCLFPGYKERLEIFGENGSIVFEGGEIVHWEIKGKEGSSKELKKTPSSGASDPMSVDYRLHMAQIKDFVDAIHEEREPLVNGEVALKSLELILAIYESSKENKLVHL